MPFPGSRTAEARVAPSEEVVATLVRWSLHTGIGNREPPDEVWPRILARVGEMEAPEAILPQRSKKLVPMAPLLQVVMVSAVLMTLGLGLQRNVPRASSTKQTVPSFEDARQGYPEDALRSYLLVKLRRAAPGQRVGGQSEI
jgi:hypothetical protein